MEMSAAIGTYNSKSEMLKLDQKIVLARPPAMHGHLSEA